jgi:Phage P22-like portal protein
MSDAGQSAFHIDHPKDAETDKDLFKECKEFLDLCIAAESDNRKRGIEALEFRDGEQWPSDIMAARGPERLALTINHTDTLVTRIENNMKQQRPRIKAHPVQDADVDKAKLVNGLIRHIENRSHASIAYDAAAGSALNIGWGYWRIIWELIPGRFDEYELKIAPIFDTFTVYRDPGSVMPDGSDAKRYIVSEKIKRTKYRQLYPQATKIDWQDTGVGETDMEWETRDEIRLAEYFRIIEKPERMFKMADGSTKYESEFAEGVLAKALKSPAIYNFATEAGKAVERRGTRPQVQWFRINGREVIDRRDLPGRYIPIVAVQGNTRIINGRTRRSGKIKNMMEPARNVNYWTTIMTERLALTPQAPWTACEGQIEGHPEWHIANRMPHSVLVWKPVVIEGQLVPSPTRLPPAQLEAGMQEAAQAAEHNLLAVAGVPHEPGQDTPGTVVSGVALKERRVLSDDNNYQFYDNQTLSISFGGQLILDYIPYFYDTPRQQRILGEDGVPEMVGINQPQQNPDGTITKKNDLTIGEYSVVMDTGPGYDTKREEAADKMTALLETPLGEPMVKAAADVVMRSFDFPNAEKIADRLMAQNPEAMSQTMKQLPEQAQSIIQALQGQLKQAGQQIQMLEADLKYGLTKTMHQEATKLQTEHLRDKRAEADTHTDAMVKLEDTHVRAQTSMNVAEIQAGSQLLNTHAEAAHDKEAAKALAANAVKAESRNGKGS